MTLLNQDMLASCRLVEVYRKKGFFLVTYVQVPEAQVVLPV